eukprot:354922-Chlamydomonas_euryale.AAC.2
MPPECTGAPHLRRLAAAGLPHKDDRAVLLDGLQQRVARRPHWQRRPLQPDCLPPCAVAGS